LFNNRIIQNASWIIVCRIVNALLSLIVGMLTARYLGPSNYGLISYAASLTAFVSPIMLLGLSEILVQEIVNKPESEGEALGSSIVMCLISSVVCVLGICSFVKVTS
jgi:O-antigen/teichoic acid export membrane protein